MRSAPRALTAYCQTRFQYRRTGRFGVPFRILTNSREEAKVMKSYVETFGYQFNAIDFAIKSTPALCIGMIVFLTLYDVF